jgi:bacteriocin-like protein
MNVQEMTEIRELTMDELNEVSGGFVWIAAFVGGAAVGYGIRRGAEAIADWLGFWSEK